MTISTQQYKFCAQVWVVCRRPGLFTKYSSIEQVVAYIDGLHEGLFGDPMHKPDDSWPLKNFCKWLIQNFECKNDSNRWSLTIFNTHNTLDIATFYNLFVTYMRETFGIEEDDYTSLDRRHIERSTEKYE